MPDELGGDKLGALNELPTLEQIEAAILRKKRNKMASWFPDTGPYRRELYPKHIEFFNAGLLHRERLFMAANRVGKTVCGSFEGTAHATGLYPPWWRGRVFEEPIVMWACNTSAPRCRDVNQMELLGQPRQLGTGMIPGELIIHTKPKPSVPDGIEIAYIRHKTGGQSVIFFKSYDQGAEKFESSAVHVIWDDEEVPSEVYAAQLLRTMTTGGILFCTYTPILGLSNTTISFLQNCTNKEQLPLECRFTNADKKDGRIETPFNES